MIITKGDPILNYAHPFNQTIINDNTVGAEVRTSIPNRVNYLCVFVGGKGRDNVLLKQTSRGEFVTEYGRPDALKYGQPILNAYASIVDQYSHAYCMRVMPTDAAYSNIIVSLKYKANGNTLTTKIVTESVPSLVNKSQFVSMVDNKTNDTDDNDGYKTVPLFGVVCKGRGKYGNSFRIRLNNAFTKRKNLRYREYRLEILDVDDGNTVVEAFEGTLYDYAEGGQSYILTDMLDADVNGSQKVDCYVNEDAMDVIYAAYNALTIPTEDKIDREHLDPIFGLNNDKTTQVGIEIEKDAEKTVVLNRLDGVGLGGGTEGSLENPTGKTVEDVIDDLYLKAFAGSIDPSITSIRRIPVKFILDAGYSTTVKKQIVQLGLKRYDAMVYLDAGIINNVDEALTFAAETAEINNRIVSKQFQHVQIRDPFNGKRVPVTVTYDLAKNLARHIETYGLGVPYTGEAYATLTGIIKGSLAPMIDESDEEIKEKLFDNRLNYYEAIAENVFARGTQETAQDLESDLSEEHNMIILLEIKDIAERETIARRYNFADAYERQLFTEILNERTKYLRELVQSISVRYDMTTQEQQKSILHCYIEVVFKTIFKSSIIEINVNKRD